jgi:GAF domain-containing protein
VARLVAAERAARQAGESAARWWQEMESTAASARTDRALDDLFREALGTIKDSLGADAVSVLVANRTGDQLVARASIGLEEEITLDLGIRSGQGMAGRVLAQRRPIIFYDLSTVDVVTPGLRNSGLRSVVAVPIIFDSRLLGVLYAGSYELGYFSPTDAELLELVADRLASALERVSAFEQEHAARLRAERTADRLARLQFITSRLATTTTLEEVAQVLSDSLSTVDLGPHVAWSNG